MEAVGLPASRSGYVQAVDPDPLVRAAVRHDLVIVLAKQVGDHVVAGITIACAWPACAWATGPSTTPRGSCGWPFPAPFPTICGSGRPDPPLRATEPALTRALVVLLRDVLVSSATEDRRHACIRNVHP